MFEVLCRFIEDEADWIKHINWNGDKQHKHAKKEIDFLYKWWGKRQNRESLDPIYKKGVPIPRMKREKIKKNGKTFYKCVFDKAWNDPKWEKASDTLQGLKPRRF